MKKQFYPIFFYLTRIVLTLIEITQFPAQYFPSYLNKKTAFPLNFAVTLWVAEIFAFPLRYEGPGWELATPSLLNCTNHESGRNNCTKPVSVTCKFLYCTGCYCIAKKQHVNRATAASVLLLFIHSVRSVTVMLYEHLHFGSTWDTHTSTQSLYTFRCRCMTEKCGCNAPCVNRV